MVDHSVAPAETLPSFRGHYPVRLEGSGRVALPAAYRFAFEAQAIIRPFRDNFLQLWNEAGFRYTRAQLDEKADRNVVSHRVLKRFNMSSLDVALDKQHRFVIPAHLQAAVGLSSEIVLAGSSEVIEIWSAEAWAEEQAALADADLFFDDFEGA